MTGPLLSPHEIATFLLDSGFIDKGMADRLERRIVAYGDTRASDGRKEGLQTCARRAAAAAAGIKSASQREGARKVLYAIERLLPDGREALKEAYSRGFNDGVELQCKRQQQKPHPRNSSPTRR